MRDSPTGSKRLVVADDEEGLLFLMSEALRREGYEVEGVSSGREVAQWLEGHEADLIILDLKLGDMPAMEVVNAWRAANRDFPFIIVTGHGDERTVVEVMKQGALDYVMKDAGMLELLPSIVRRALDSIDREKKLSVANAAVRKRERRHRNIIQTALDGFACFDRGGRISEVNAALCELLGYSQQEILEKSVFEAEGSAFRQTLAGHVAKLEPGGATHCFTHLAHKDGSMIEAEVSLREDEGEIFAFVHDVTLQRRLEREVLQATLAERRQLGRELHDGVGQQLTALELMIQTLANALRTEAPKQAKAAFELTQYIRKAVAQIREIAHGMSPVASEGEGLMMALQELAQMTTATGIECEFECKKPVSIKDPASETHLCRIAQEAVTNALKHAKPKRILIRLEERPDEIELMISDDGRGVKASKPKGDGIGLQVIQHRARLIGGRTEFETAPGKGTKIVCIVPLTT